MLEYKQYLDNRNIVADSQFVEAKELWQVEVQRTQTTLGQTLDQQCLEK